MENTVKIRLFDSTVGNDFAYGKGINDVPADRAAILVRDGLAEYINPPQTKTAQAPHQKSEKAVSPAAKTAEKR